MLESVFPAWTAKREQAKYLASVYKKAAGLIESTPEFAQDEDEGDWTLLAGNKDSYSEADLDTLREQARKLYYKDPGARGLIGSMVGFILGRNASVAATDEDAQAYWDAWCNDKQNKFDRRSKELVRRLLRDGEFFLRLFKANGQINYEYGEEGKKQSKTADYLAVRFIDPEEIKDKSNTHSYGIETDPDDVETVLKYHRCFFKNNIEDTEEIDAEEIVHGKILCDSNEKRGKSFFIGIAKYLKNYQLWLDDRIRLNRIRNFFHLVIKPEGAFSAEALKAKFKDESTTAAGRTPNKKMPKPGSAIVAKGVDYEFKNLNINATDTKDDGRNIERMICKGTQLVEGVVTGDYSNQNYASALVAESPMVKAIEDWQDVIGDYIKEIFKKIVRFGKTAGAIPEAASEECSVNFDSMVHRDLEKDTTAYQIHRQNGWASDKTISAKLGYDYEDEQAQIDIEGEKEKNRAQADEPEYT